MLVSDYPIYPNYTGVSITKNARPVVSKNFVEKPYMPIAYTQEMITFVSQVTLNPYWIAGLVAGEGCFMIGISNSKSVNVGRQVKPNFQIALTRTNQHLLWAIWEYFGKIGSVCSGGLTMARLQIGSITDINNIIIPFLINILFLVIKLLIMRILEKLLVYYVIKNI